jgi:hypothetical protein
MQNLETIHEEFCSHLDELDEFLNTLRLPPEKGSKLASILSNLILCTDSLYQLFENSEDLSAAIEQRDTYAHLIREHLLPRLSMEEVYDFNMKYEMEVRDI